MCKRVFVTGGCGFLGSHVCEYYIQKGAQVVSYDNLAKHEIERTGFAAEKARNYNWNYLKGLGVNLIKADVRNAEELLDAATGCDYIIHTAAQPAMTNIYGNKINEGLKESKTQYIREPAGIDEKYPTLEGTLTPLHASKAAGDMYVRVYIDTYKLEAASFRLTGIYGTRQFGGEDHGWVANFSIRSVLGWPITIYGTGKQVRDIVCATDICEAFNAFYVSRKSGIYNIGGGKQTALSLLECIDIIEKVNGFRPEVQFAPDRHGDLRYFVCDISKAQRELNWSPQIMPREGVAKLIAWIKDNRGIFSAKA
ncbi:MAG: NAD-dependent epimerase/dehydratase family protein [Proteobacteria bacterium]|nr:NAD-dependent epimerase/dehydratase family protein [Pseudomonadota bacterium]